MKLVLRFKAIINERGFIFTFIIALFCFILFFWKILLHPNKVYFGPSGDGIQTYYNSLYHVKYDSTYWHFNGMNYPYGEQVFFTSCQAFVTNQIKRISRVIDISDYTIGILNFIMLFSIFLSSLCLYLVFKQLRLHYIYSGIAATSIAFLSPQIIRLGAHYCLTYQFAIPLFLLLLIKFHQNPSIKKSFLICLLVFFMSGIHFYFFGFFGLIAFFYWFFSFLSSINFSNLIFTIKHFFIQIAFPFVTFKFIFYLIDNVKDRTAHPSGFLTYITNFAGVFYPTNFPFEHIFAAFYIPSLPATDEGYSYVGIVALIGCILIILEMVKHIIYLNFKDAFIITDNKILNRFFWAAVAALFISFGYPFIIKGYEHWLNKIGLLQQIRGIARFAWVFYYIINIVVIYKIYFWIKNFNPILKNSILFITLYLICQDAFTNVYKEQNWINNTIPRLADKENKLSEDNWLNEINLKSYQAIISLPYFHVGSENVSITSDSHIKDDIYIICLKTGIPMVNVSLSRTSLSQTYKNIKIDFEPYRKLEIINDFKNKKPFLVLAEEKDMNDGEKKLLSVCKKIKTTPLFNVYELSVDALSHISDNLYDNTFKGLNKTKTYKIDNFNYTDSIKTFVFLDFNNLNTNKSFMDKGCYKCKVVNGCDLYNDTVPNFTKEQPYRVSFWMDNFTEDTYPHIWFVLETFDINQVSQSRIVYPMKDKFKIVDGNKALIETDIVIKHKTDKLKVYISNYELPNENIEFRADNLFISPVKDTIYKKEINSIMMNNRIYIKNEK